MVTQRGERAGDEVKAQLLRRTGVQVRHPEGASHLKGRLLLLLLRSIETGRAEPILAPIERGPFYAIKVLPGSFGTFFGRRTDPESRVLHAAGEADPGAVRRGGVVRRT